MGATPPALVGLQLSRRKPPHLGLNNLQASHDNDETERIRRRVERSRHRARELNGSANVQVCFDTNGFLKVNPTSGINRAILGGASVRSVGGNVVNRGHEVKAGEFADLRFVRSVSQGIFVVPLV